MPEAADIPLPASPAHLRSSAVLSRAQGRRNTPAVPSLWDSHLPGRFTAVCNCSGQLCPGYTPDLPLRGEGGQVCARDVPEPRVCQKRSPVLGTVRSRSAGAWQRCQEVRGQRRPRASAQGCGKQQPAVVLFAQHLLPITAQGYNS